jgi:TM2 domain-containing membrane protein YozV
MKCAHHPETDSVAFCAQCGRALCAACKHEVKGATYCEECLALHMHAFNPLAPTVGPSPGIALALGFIPGVGAIYNGQVIKGMVQVLLFGSLIAFSNRVGGPFDAIFGLGAAAFYFYMVIDSFQTAKAKLMGREAPEWFGLSDMKMNAPIGAALLIGLGVLFLLDNFGIPVIRELGKFWPVLLIVIGIILLQRRMGGGAAHPSQGAQPSDTNKQGPTNIPGPQGM